LGRALSGRGDVELRLFGPTWAPAPRAADVRGWPRTRLFRARVPSKALVRSTRAFGLGAERFFRGGADVVHHTQYRRLPTRRPEIATVHDLVYLDTDRFVGAGVAQRMSAFAREAARTARVLVTPSATVADEVRERLDVDPGRVVPTPLGVDHVLRWPAGPAEVGAPYVLTVARIESRKNHLGVLRALERLGSAAPRWIVVGPRGEGAEEFLRAVERSPLRSGIELRGRVPEAALRGLVEGALACVLVPFDEGFGLGPLEAMRLGTPAVTSDVPVVREVCGGGAALADPAEPDAIAQAVSSVLDGRDRASARGLDHASAFTWARTAAETVRAYRRAL
ncbi:MAG: glycosyltransferase family 1 protein, partial [Planctomycetota bacterium]